MKPPEIKLIKKLDYDFILFYLLYAPIFNCNFHNHSFNNNNYTFSYQITCIEQKHNEKNLTKLIRIFEQKKQQIFVYKNDLNERKKKEKGKIHKF
jgi:hypothetical protein